MAHAGSDGVTVDAGPGIRPVPLVEAIPLPWWKRGFDLAVAGSVFLATVPVMIAVAAVSRVVFGSPILYRQERGGLGGTVFEIIKFRTMTNATDATGELLPDEERRNGWGNFLRRTSLDELPTLLNIIRGEMSIVGPRPLMAIYLERYSARERQRHRVTPGLTGLAQTRGRNTLDWSERFELDLAYIDRRSVRTDLRILWDTISIVVTREGADGNDHCVEFLGSSADDHRPTIDLRDPAREAS